MRKWLLPAMICLNVLPGHGSAAERILFHSDFSKGGTNGWKNVGLFKGLTDYVPQTEGTNCFIRARANDSCSALTAKLDLKPSGRLVLRWRWRIAAVAANGSDSELGRFDHAARVFVAFDTFIGPPRTLNYLWADAATPGSLLKHPLTSRAKLFVVESGNDKAGRWIGEERDVTADWERAFPGRKMPKIVAVGILTDSDSLKGKLSGDYADIELIQE